MDILHSIGFVIMTALVYILSNKLYKKTKLSILNPVLISTLIIILILKKINVSYEKYNKGGEVITYFLGPIVVLLAVPLYNSRTTLKKHMKPVLLGIITGIVSSFISVVVFGKIFNIDSMILKSLYPKSITSPLAIEATQIIKGDIGITVVAVVITGIIGASIAPVILKYSKFKSNIAKGIGIGTSSHGLGTSKALEINEETGAASGLAMGLTGLFTVVLFIILNFFDISIIF